MLCGYENGDLISVLLQRHQGLPLLPDQVTQPEVSAQGALPGQEQRQEAPTRPGQACLKTEEVLHTIQLRVLQSGAERLRVARGIGATTRRVLPMVPDQVAQPEGSVQGAQPGQEQGQEATAFPRQAGLQT